MGAGGGTGGLLGVWVGAGRLGRLVMVWWVLGWYVGVVGAGAGAANIGGLAASAIVWLHRTCLCAAIPPPLADALPCQR